MIMYTREGSNREAVEAPPNLITVAITDCLFVDSRAAHVPFVAIYATAHGSQARLSIARTAVSLHYGAAVLLVRGNVEVDCSQVLFEDCVGSLRLDAASHTVLRDTVLRRVSGSLASKHASVESHGRLELFDSLFSNSSSVRLIGREVTHLSRAVFYNVSFESPDFSVKFGTRNGSAVYIEDRASLEWYGGSATNLTAVYQGAVFAEPRALLHLEGVNFTACKAGNGGGAVAYALRGTHQSLLAVSRIKRCVFTGNSAPSGSAIFHGSGFKMLHVEECTFEYNTGVDEATGGAGAIAAVAGALTVERSLLQHNVAPFGRLYRGGGAINVGPAQEVRVSGSSFVNNSVLSGYGGAISVDTLHTHVLVSDSVFRDNEARGGYGGAIAFTIPSQWIDSNTIVSLTNCTLTDNKAMVGGALYAHNTTSNHDHDPPLPGPPPSGEEFLALVLHTDRNTMQRNSALAGNDLAGEPSHLLLTLDRDTVYPGESVIATVSIIDLMGQLLIGPAVEQYLVQLGVEFSDGSQEWFGLMTFSRNAREASMQVTMGGGSGMATVVAHTSGQTNNSTWPLTYQLARAEALPVEMSAASKVNVLSSCRVNQRMVVSPNGERQCFECEPAQYALQNTCLECPMRGPTVAPCIVEEQEEGMEGAPSHIFNPAPGYYCSPQHNSTHLYRCLDPSACQRSQCNATETYNDCTTSCRRGHEERLCAQCAAGFFHSAGGCKECAGAGALSALWAAAVLCWLVAVVCLALDLFLAHLVLLLVAMCLLFSLCVVKWWVVVFVLAVCGASLIGSAAARLVALLESRQSTTEEVDEVLRKLGAGEERAEGESDGLLGDEAAGACWEKEGQEEWDDPPEDSSAPEQINLISTGAGTSTPRSLVTRSRWVPCV
eukprot:TRINITY_DN9426_c0_g1_i1.p1 TRINITY_DN9426_c0_g1~~TRINITY_DN9426_c0_g1_i1.p1  ORF type:complete len:945 (-),score=257.42 TRINITY_DN9426_c0_g1_i1:1748-4408(-)